MDVVVLLFPDVTQLDFTGPVQVFSGLADTTVHLAWHTLDPVPTDGGFSVVPTTTLADCPPADVLMVPGGNGTWDVVHDEVALDFVRRQAAGATWVTSVCTGSFVLAAAGLLAGRRATTHWASLPMLADLGVVPVAERVVVDGNRVTGAGVTSGIDVALRLVAMVAGDDEARARQLGIEYDPDPPFDAGSPRTTDPAVVAAARVAARERRGDHIAALAARLGQPVAAGVSR